VQLFRAGLDNFGQPPQLPPHFGERRRPDHHEERHHGKPRDERRPPHKGQPMPPQPDFAPAFICLEHQGEFCFASLFIVLNVSVHPIPIHLAVPHCVPRNLTESCIDSAAQQVVQSEWESLCQKLSHDGVEVLECKAHFVCGPPPRPEGRFDAQEDEFEPDFRPHGEEEEDSNESDSRGPGRRGDHAGPRHNSNDDNERPRRGDRHDEKPHRGGDRNGPRRGGDRSHNGPRRGDDEEELDGDDEPHRGGSRNNGPRRGDRDDDEEPRRGGDRNNNGPRRGDHNDNEPHRGGGRNNGPNRGDSDDEPHREGHRNNNGPRRGDRDDNDEPRRGGDRDNTRGDRNGEQSLRGGDRSNGGPRRGGDSAKDDVEQGKGRGNNGPRRGEKPGASNDSSDRDISGEEEIQDGETRTNSRGQHGPFSATALVYAGAACGAGIVVGLIAFGVYTVVRRRRQAAVTAYSTLPHDDCSSVPLAPLTPKHIA
jgi:hypothetical protein